MTPSRLAFETSDIAFLRASAPPFPSFLAAASTTALEAVRARLFHHRLWVWRSRLWRYLFSAETWVAIGGRFLRKLSLPIKRNTLTKPLKLQEKGRLH